MKYTQSRLALILTGLVGGVVLLASSGVYAGNAASLYSPPLSAIDEDQDSEAFHYTVLSYHEEELDGSAPGVWADDDGQLAHGSKALDEKPLDDSLDSRGPSGTGIGMGVTPLFDTYGVVRARSSHDKSTYVALGFISDELTLDEADILDSENKKAFSYGFGVNSSSSNFEYMMSMDQKSSGVSAVGMRFTSEF
jgi:hypothetical protein